MVPSMEGICWSDFLAHIHPDLEYIIDEFCREIDADDLLIDSCRLMKISCDLSSDDTHVLLVVRIDQTIEDEAKSDLILAPPACYGAKLSGYHSQESSLNRKA
jgi:hypothetical protein